MVFLYLLIIILVIIISRAIRKKVFQVYIAFIRGKGKRGTKGVKKDNLTQRDIDSLTYNYHIYLKQYKESQQAKGFGFRKKNR
ncbi:MAG: hypothetical protein ACLFUI_02010 [Halanaerobiales bacterium]